MLKRESRKVL